MRKACTRCAAPFEISSDDLSFYEKVSPVLNGKRHLIPPPTLCPRCRLQRRMVFRNQIYVYRRPSSLTQKLVFSRFPPDVPFPVVENEWWYGNAWDGLAFGRDVDWNTPFFTQLRALRDVVPHRTLSLHQAQNCDYCNNDTGVSDCYLVFNTTGAEDLMYCENCVKARDCIDCTYCPSSELCYDCTMCERCYNIQSGEFCEDCSESTFLSHCYSCRNCFGCINLSHKQYCVFNEQKTEKDYRAFLRSFTAESWKEREETRAHCRKLWATHPRPHSHIQNAEAVTGNYILNSKDVRDSFFIQDCEDLQYCFNLYANVRSARDFTFFGRNSELMYEAVQCGIDDVNVVLSFDCWGSNSNLFYCWMCEGCKDCFGCVGLQKKQHCILNKQYSKEEYETMAEKVIAHMRKDDGAPNQSLRSGSGQAMNPSEPQRARGSWGEFFPMSLSPFPYNHSVAQRYFPLSQKEAKDNHCTWYNREMTDARQAIDASALPDGLPATDDPLTAKSEESGRPFRITTQEIKRYRRLGAPLPRKTYDERMEDRMRILGGIELHERTCAKTGKKLLTTFPPTTPFPIWDREAYNAEFRG